MTRWLLLLVLMWLAAGPATGHATDPDLSGAWAAPPPQTERPAIAPGIDPYTGLRRHAVWGGVAGAAVGWALPVAWTAISAHPQVIFTALITVPISAAFGVGLMSDGHGIGWKVLGAAAGMAIAALPTAGFLALTGVSIWAGAPALAVLFGTASIAIAVGAPAVGATTAARRAGLHRAGIALIPTPSPDGAGVTVLAAF